MQFYLPSNREKIWRSVREIVIWFIVFSFLFFFFFFLSTMALICVMSSYSYSNIFPAAAFWIVQKCPNLRLNSRRIEATFVWASDLSRWCVHRRLKYARYSNIRKYLSSVTYLPTYHSSHACAHIYLEFPHSVTSREPQGTLALHFAAPGNYTKVRDSGTFWGV